jgi:hypothetical protein
MIRRFFDYILLALVTTFIHLQMMSLYLREMARSTSNQNVGQANQHHLQAEPGIHHTEG